MMLYRPLLLANLACMGLLHVYAKADNCKEYLLSEKANTERLALMSLDIEIELVTLLSGNSSLEYVSAPLKEFFDRGRAMTNNRTLKCISELPKEMDASIKALDQKRDEVSAATSKAWEKLNVTMEEYAQRNETAEEFEKLFYEFTNLTHEYYDLTGHGQREVSDLISAISVVRRKLSVELPKVDLTQYSTTFDEWRSRHPNAEFDRMYNPTAQMRRDMKAIHGHARTVMQPENKSPERSVAKFLRPACEADRSNPEKVIERLASMINSKYVLYDESTGTSGCVRCSQRRHE